MVVVVFGSTRDLIIRHFRVTFGGQVPVSVKIRPVVINYVKTTKGVGRG